jgi:propanol-preferring alcohol dehydrogenase
MQGIMKAAVVHEFGAPLVIEEVPIPQPGQGEVQIRLDATGVCHTDLHAADGDWPVKPTLPFIPGHEGAGHISAVGPGVTGLKIGDCVGVPWLHSACGICEFCISGRETLCEAQQNTGYSVNGTFAEYVVAVAAFVARLPEESNLMEMAPVLCAGVTVYKGLKMTEARAGDWVVVSGIGGLGHLAVQYAKQMDFRVAAIDVDDDKLDLAKRLGATLTINARKVNPGEFVHKEFGGAHGVLVTAASVKAFEQGLTTLRRGGTMTLIGLLPGSLSLDIIDTVMNAHTVRGSVVGTRTDLTEALAMAGKGGVKATITIEKLEDINEVFGRLRKGDVEGRIVLDLTGAQKDFSAHISSPFPFG